MADAEDEASLQKVRRSTRTNTRTTVKNDSKLTKSKSETKTVNKSKSSKRKWAELDSEGDSKPSQTFQTNGKKTTRNKKKVIFSDSEEDEEEKVVNGEGENEKVKEEAIEKVVEMDDVKTEKEDDVEMNDIKVEKEDVDEIPIAQRRRKLKDSKGKAKKTEEDSDAPDEVPLAQRKKNQKTPVKENDTKRKRQIESESSSDSELDTISKTNGNKSSSSKVKPQSKRKKQVKQSEESEASEEKKPVRHNGKKAPAKSKTSKASAGKAPSKKGKQKVPESSPDDQSEEEDEEYKWWKENAQGDGTVKWQTLEHNGVLFPPEYVPHGVKMKFKGEEVYLEPEAEEVASFYAAMLNSEHVQNETFCRNFFADWVMILKKSNNNPPIRDYDKDHEHCDFTPIFDYFEKEKERKKAMSKEEKQKIKEEKLKLESQYAYCILDGRKEKVGNFRIEPPGLFRGRGKHPKTGKLKLRVAPESVTINIGKDAKIPDPPSGHAWGNVIHDNTVTWLATWKENVNDSIKYVFLAANSSLKGQSDLKKFEKSRELKQHVARIRSEYTRDLKDKLMETRQRATAMYLIDRFALRAGNEKDEKNEADTVGCCSLRLEHVTLNPPKQVIFDFLGKDSIRYYNDVEVDEQVWKNLNIFKRKPKTDSDLLFDRLNTTLLNKYLSKQMAGLTAKVFRTYNASHTFQEQLQKGMEELEEECKGKEMTIHEKIFKYNKANREVAVLCNHQRTVSKAHENQMTKIVDKIRAFKYQRMKLKKMLFTLNPKLKKRAEYAEEESDMDEEWIIRHEKLLMEKEREKARSKFEKDNEKLVAENQKPKTEKELNTILQEIDEREKELVEERKSKKIEVKKGTTVEKLKDQISKINEKIDATKLSLKDKDENKQTALGTSKTNYIDPRISAAWCYKYGVPIEKIFNRSLREKFKWSLEVDADWEF